MEQLNYNQVIDKLNSFLSKKNIQVDNVILVCLILFIILEEINDIQLLVILFLLIF